MAPAEIISIKNAVAIIVVTIGLPGGMVIVANATWFQDANVVASDGETSDEFGFALSGLSSSTFAVGAYEDDDKGYSSGSVYVFTRNGAGNDWVQSDKVVALDGETGASFGCAVSGLSSSIFSVGADEDDDMGSVYVFTSSNGVSWVQSDKVVASDGEDSDYFGWAVSGLSNSTFSVGAYGDSGIGSNSGSAYVFTSSNGSSWMQSDKVVASDGEAYDYFGYAVSGLSSSILTVGAFGDSDMGSYSGSIYVFISSNGSSWVQSVKVVTLDGKAYDHFGWAVSGLSSSTFAAGAYGVDDDTGSVYVFTSRNGVSWVQANKVIASDGKADDQFGWAVSSLSSSSFVAGAYGEDGMGSSSGSVYIFTSTNGVSWVQSDKVVASDGETDDQFGWAVSGLSDSTFSVGAHGNDNMGSSSGSVYVFTYGCESDSQCGDPEPVCSDHACAACTSDSECSLGSCLVSGACGFTTTPMPTTMAIKAEFKIGLSTTEITLVVVLPALVILICCFYFATQERRKKKKSQLASAATFTPNVAGDEEKGTGTAGAAFITANNDPPDLVKPVSLTGDGSSRQASPYQHVAFLSHCKRDTGTAALHLKEVLTKHGLNKCEKLGTEGAIFLDSDDLHDLSQLLHEVERSKNMIVVLSENYLSRPWCLLELWKAFSAGVNIVPVLLKQAGHSSYDFQQAERYKENLRRAPGVNGKVLAMLQENGASVIEVQHAVRRLLQKIAVEYNVVASKRVRDAQLDDILCCLMS